MEHNKQKLLLAYETGQSGKRFWNFVSAVIGSALSITIHLEGDIAWSTLLDNTQEGQSSNICIKT